MQLNPIGKTMAPRVGVPQVVHGLPPNFDQIAAAIPAANKPGTIFTYGNAIYVSDGAPLSRSLLAHEGVHILQQKNYPGGPSAWWDRYLTEPAWRFLQELNAHQAEYRTACEGKDRAHRRFLLGQIAGRLAGPLYGRFVKLEEAKRLILGRDVLFSKITGEALALPGDKMPPPI